MAEQSVLNAVLAKKLDFLSTIASVSMSWWVSGVVFCATFVGVVYNFRSRIEDPTVIRLLEFGLGAFFLSCVCYGFIAVLGTSRLEDETNRILRVLQESGELGYTPGMSEFAIVKRAITLGTTSFGLLLSAWVYACVSGAIFK